MAEPGGLEKKVDDSKPDLEKIANQLANMEENHKMNQVLPTILETFVNFKGVKYTDDKGIEHYKTKFTVDEATKMADAIFDKMAYHAHLRRYKDMTSDQFEALKKLKDADGHPLMDAEIERAFGISRQALRNMILENREDLTSEHLVGLAQQSLKHHREFVGNKILAPLQNEEYRDQVKEFIDKYVVDKGLAKKDYKLKKGYTIKDALPLYQKIADAYFRKDAAKKETPK